MKNINKNKIFPKLLIGIIFLNIYGVNIVFGSIYNYNTVEIETALISDNISSGPSAKVEVRNHTHFSGITLTSIGSYNQVIIETPLIGDPISSGPSALVNISLVEEVDGNIQTILERGYNTVIIETPLIGDPISSGPSALVNIKKNDLTSTGSDTTSISAVYNTVFVETQLIGNDSITSGPSAKVEVIEELNDFGLQLPESEFYNTVIVDTPLIGEPISSGPSAKVEIISDELRKGVIQTIDDSETDSDGKKIIRIIETDSPDSSSTLLVNSINYILTGQKPDLYNHAYLIEKDGGFSASQIPNIKINKGETIIFGENNIFQNIIKNKGTGEKIKSGDRLNVSVVFDSEIEFTDVVEITNIPVNPLLLYPYILPDGEYEYNISKDIIKGMAYPNSVLKVDLDGEIYYAYVDEKGLFNFKINKFNIGNVPSVKNLKFNYVIIDGEPSNYTLGNANYEIKLTNDSFTQPYISNIYNDDDIYSDKLYFAGYSNPGKLNYRIRNISNTATLLEGTTIVGEDKSFEILLLDDIAIKKDYIIEIWNEGGLKERKAFRLKGNTLEKIGIISHADYDTIITTRPTIVGYSKLSVMNNDTIRGYACQIGVGSTIDKCPEDKKIFIGSTNADKNGLFKFQSIYNFENDKIYLINLYNTSNMDYHKNIILKIDTSGDISKSNLTNIKNGIKVNTNNLVLEGYTLTGSTVEITDYTGNSLKNNIGINNFGYFNTNIKLPNDGIFKVKYLKGSDLYEQIYKLDYDETYEANISGHNYFMDFNAIDFRPIELKR